MNAGNGIVVGASSGIGRALTERLAVAGSTLTALSRRGVTPGVDSALVYARKADIRDFSALVAEISAAKDRHGVSFVVNCVGVGYYAPIGADYAEAWTEILTTNVVGVLNLLSAVDTVLTDLDRFVHVSSIAAHTVSRVPGNICYSVSKAAARTIVEEYRRTLHEQGRPTRVSMVSPGFVEDTDFGVNFFARAPQAVAFDPYAQRTNLQAADVASTIMQILAQPPKIEIADVVLLPKEHSK